MQDLTVLSPYQIRQLCRSGEFASNTSGLAPGFVQANMAIIPAAYAADFLQFCHFFVEYHSNQDGFLQVCLATHQFLQ